MAKIYTIEELKAIIIPIAKKYGIQKVYLFGSIARAMAMRTAILICV